MAELRLNLSPVVAVLASSEACDRVVAAEGVIAMRIAPREVLLIGKADADAEADAEADADVLRRALDEPSAIVDEVTDGWAMFQLTGDDAREAFARVCELEPPDQGWVQGEVAGAAAKVIVDPGGLTILVPAMLGAHVEERIRADAAELLAP